MPPEAFGHGAAVKEDERGRFHRALQIFRKKELAVNFVVVGGFKDACWGAR